MGYLNTLLQFDAWKHGYEDRELYKLVVAQEMRQYWRANLQTKTHVLQGSLSEADFDMLCDYIYNLYLKINGPMDVSLLVAVVKHLLDSKQIKLKDIQANKKETEELILEQAIGTED